MLSSVNKSSGSGLLRWGWILPRRPAKKTIRCTTPRRTLDGAEIWHDAEDTLGLLT